MAHTKIGRDHKHLTAPYGITEIETTATKLRPQVAHQHDPIFLITENETTAAEVFKLLGRVDVVTEAQRLARKDLKTASDRRAIRIEDRTAATAKRDELAPIPTIRAAFNLLRRVTRGRLEDVELTRNCIAATKELIELKPRTLPVSPTLGVIQFRELNQLRELVSLSPRPIPEAPFISLMGPELLDALAEYQTTTAEWRNINLMRRRNETEQRKLQIAKIAMEGELSICPTCQRPFHG